MWLIRRLIEEVRATIARPRRLRRITEWPHVVAFIRRFFTSRSERHLGARWQDAGEGGFQRRAYVSYDAYVRHQVSKLKTLSLSDYDVQYRDVLCSRLRTGGLVAPGTSVLCLAARLGTEVRAFHDLGCFAVGTDLNPGRENQYVVHGDFHAVQFPDDCVDVVFTNAIDHALDVHRLRDEIVRVLKPGGLAIIEASYGSDEGDKPGFYESLYWRSIDELIGLFTGPGLEVVHRTAFDYPWRGEHICLRSPVSSPVVQERERDEAGLV